MKIVNSLKMSEIDSIAQSEYRIPGIILMENAGIHFYEYLYKNIWNNKVPHKTVFAAGKGNNGGDTFVMARQHFLKGESCCVIVPDFNFREGLAKTHLDICSSLGIEIIDWGNNSNIAQKYLSGADWIIEGISGTGLKGELSGYAADIAECINSSEAEVCSVDIPSGVGDSYKEGYCAVDADYTITVELPKFSLYTPSGRKKCGHIASVPIGFPPPLVNDPAIKDKFLNYKDTVNFIKKPSPYSYKNKKGHTLVLGGSKGMTGAPVLASKAALNSLSGLVTLKVTEDISTSLPSFSPSLLTGTIDYSVFDEVILEKYTSIVIGPGWGQTEIKKNWLKKLLTRSSIPLVIDADAITVLSELLSEGFKIKNSCCVLTPHIGEFSRIINVNKRDLLDNPLPFIKDFSVKNKLTIVLKSHVIWISDSKGCISIIDGCNPAMATAGSGDILSGITGGLLSYGLDPLSAASAAVLIHQKSGLMCYNENGFFESERMIKYIGKAIKESF